MKLLKTYYGCDFCDKRVESNEKPNREPKKWNYYFISKNWPDIYDSRKEELKFLVCDDCINENDVSVFKKIWKRLKKLNEKKE